MNAVVRRLDSLGRLVIPKELRIRYGYGENSSFEILLDEERQRIVLKTLPKNCCICGSSDNTVQVPGKQQKWLCKKCLRKIVAMLQSPAR